jgi:CIC family chloride channel protein
VATGAGARSWARIWRSENLVWVILATVVGLVGGVGAIFFRFLIEAAGRLFFGGGRHALPFLGEAYVILLPAVGLTIVSLIVRRWAPEAQGHGVPEVMYAIRREGGRIRPRVAGIKALASAICIGSGGSVGREGPIVQIGCTIGSAVGQLLKLREGHVRLLVACGAAAGVGGTFNAPIAGVLFALEVILGSFQARSFGLVVISSVAATAVCQAALGPEQAFELPQEFSLATYLELPIYLVLGLVSGLAALLFVKILYFEETLFERWRRRPILAAIAGGLGVGLLGYVGWLLFGGGYLFGVGYDGIEATLALGATPEWNAWTVGGLSIGGLLLLVLLKILATSTTLAAGGSGGVFAPSIFIGAMLGGAFGLTVNAIFPGATAPPGAYALVGMGAVFAGTAHAPITSILILFEMTDDYLIILPLMIAVVISYLVASNLLPDSIYTIKLRRRGGFGEARSPTSALDAILVFDAMSTDHGTVRPGEPVRDLAARFHASHVRAYCVLDDEERLVGIVTQHDLESALMAGAVEGRTTGDIMTRGLITCWPDERLREVLQRLRAQDVGQIPVVARDDPGRLLGVLRRREILWAYGELASEHTSLLERTGADLPAGESVKIELEVRPEYASLCDRPVAGLGIPEDCLCILLRRADRSIVPRGRTVVEPGDVLVLVTVPEHEARLRGWVESVTRGGPV